MTEHLIDPKFDPIDDSVNPIPQISELFGMFQTVSAVPTATPKRLINQIQFYSSGATYRLYIYDTTNNVWRYSTLT